ncbi:cryptochrome/photolyase family protein [Shewanella xiamenensis]|uniref:cryptochrome/photolyase family protein n=1 Tax=Shewanella xiamenensis TaxID=332186 RepID=UPI00313ABA4A
MQLRQQSQQQLQHFHTVRLILGDQLNAEHTWYQQVDPKVLYLIAELHQENTYVTHHVQKICAFFSAMAQFASELGAAGHQVRYLTLDDTQDFVDLNALLQHYVAETGAIKFEYQRPDEYRLLAQLSQLKLANAVVNCVDTEHFLLPFDEIDREFPQGQHRLMEHFYRRMRKRFNILMTDGKPVGGQWNFDANNRQKLKSQDIKSLPTPLMFGHNVQDILERLTRHGINTMGKADTHLLWPINRVQSLELLQYFCEYCLPAFGRFQDAMTQQHPAQWSLYHSRLSFSLNAKLISPLEVINAVIEHYHANPFIEIAQVEGFVRQIIGWREYVRGIYWANMPNYANINALEAKRKLPDYFWHGKTRMNCLHHALSQSLDYAYAHHIQRLMVIGNFCLLTGIAPDEVDKWYLGVYVDAIEWVEMPNTRGMALFADGGIVGTKPYAASGSYINKMSDYCGSCHYKIKERSGESACPLNSLYWRFMDKHRAQLTHNPRIAMLYRTWDNTEESVKQAILATAEQHIAQLEWL